MTPQAWVKTSSAYQVLNEIFWVCCGYFYAGFFAYTSGCVIIVEDLNAGSQHHFIGVAFSLVLIGACWLTSFYYYY